MAGMSIEEIVKYLEEAKRIFPDSKLSDITIQGENGLMSMIKFTKEEVGESSNEFALIPSGQYNGQIINHEWKETKKGGHMLALTIEITGPSHEGRRIWDNLNLDCDNEDAQKIALRSYKAICTAGGVEAFYDSIFEIDEATAQDYFEALPEQLYSKDISFKLGVEKSKDPQYADKNKIMQYGGPVSTSKPFAAAKPSAAANGKAKPSWAK